MASHTRSSLSNLPQFQPGSHEFSRVIGLRRLNDSQSAANSIMIGDREFDAIGALANDMQFVGVTYGFGSEKELKNAGATRFVKTTAGLSPVLKELTG